MSVDQTNEDEDRLLQSRKSSDDVGRHVIYPSAALVWPRHRQLAPPRPPSPPPRPSRRRESKPKASGRSQGLQRRRPRPEVAALTEWAACDSQVDALIARNQEAELKNNAATVIQSRVRSRRRRRAKLFVGGRGGSGRATPVDDVGVGVGSSVDASPVGVRPPALTGRNTFAELPPNPNLQTDAMGRMARLCFGNFLDEVVSDFATVTGTEGRNNPSMLELAQRHHEARDEAQGQMDGQQVRPNAFRQHNLAGR